MPSPWRKDSLHVKMGGSTYLLMFLSEKWVFVALRCEDEQVTYGRLDVDAVPGRGRRRGGGVGLANFTLGLLVIGEVPAAWATRLADYGASLGRLAGAGSLVRCDDGENGGERERRAHEQVTLGQVRTKDLPEVHIGSCSTR